MEMIKDYIILKLSFNFKSIGSQDFACRDADGENKIFLDCSQTHRKKELGFYVEQVASPNTIAIKRIYDRYGKVWQYLGR